MRSVRSRQHTRRIALLLCAAIAEFHGSAAASASLRLGRAFTSHAVFQRGQTCPIFGTDTPGTRITVQFAGQTWRTIAAADGRWRVNLAPLAANLIPQTMTVVGTTKITLANLLIGDVWLISGQSNADWPLRSATGGAVAISSATNSSIRYLQMAESPRTDPPAWNAEQISRLTPERYFTGTWQVNDPSSAGSVSAVGYFFVRHLATNQNVPMGLIDCAVGGTPTESWIPIEAIRRNPRLAAMATNYLTSPAVASFVKKRILQNLAERDNAGRPAPMPEHPYEPGACWRLGLASIAPFALRGVLWYQGESNADFYDSAEFDTMAARHIDAFQTLVASWRMAWERADLPVYAVQLPQMNRPSWPWFRESQWQCSQMISNTALAVAFDYGEPDSVHPVNKQPVADRLAYIARRQSYGENIESSGPVLRSWSVQSGSLILQFDHATGGLVAADAQPLRLFEIAGANRQFFPATATISNAALIVSASQVPQPIAVRYAWSPTGNINFFNGAGLPTSPFRTDIWPAHSD